ncbi:MAG: hypothetical protein K2W81_00490 [Sphingomonas sp.]|nr:hypothetical protein [Sphingomonas sp.]
MINSGPRAIGIESNHPPPFALSSSKGRSFFARASQTEGRCFDKLSTNGPDAIQRIWSDPILVAADWRSYGLCVSAPRARAGR